MAVGSLNHRYVKHSTLLLSLEPKKEPLFSAHRPIDHARIGKSLPQLNLQGPLITVPATSARSISGRSGWRHVRQGLGMFGHHFRQFLTSEFGQLVTIQAINQLQRTGGIPTVDGQAIVTGLGPE